MLEVMVHMLDLASELLGQGNDFSLLNITKDGSGVKSDLVDQKVHNCKVTHYETLAIVGMR